ncbi:hypothetical protein [Streptomyces spinosus]|uniref:hypothetical protein n=1 Tax=Streptomyces spinosus TaxID=2872623 RepID=UPI001CEC58A0|nr:hypothetical protein [Streptomyces spinosus]
MSMRFVAGSSRRFGLEITRAALAAGHQFLLLVAFDLLVLHSTAELPQHVNSAGSPYPRRCLG